MIILFFSNVVQTDVWQANSFTGNSMAALDVYSNNWSGCSSDVLVSNITELHTWWLQRELKKASSEKNGDFLLQLMIEGEKQLVKGIDITVKENEPILCFHRIDQ